jgi:hypothetical protein
MPMDEEAIAQELVEFLCEFETEDGGVDMVGLAAWMVEAYIKIMSPSFKDLEDLQVTLKNATLIFDQLIEQEKAKWEVEEE